MLKKISLYIDTIKRISPKQNFYLIKEKLLKKILPVSISSRVEIEKQISLINRRVKFQNISNQLKLHSGDYNIWDAGIKFAIPKHHYVIFISEILTDFSISSDEKVLSKLWEREHDDIEFLYNVQRMYLFAELMESLNFSDNQKLTVLISWIDNFPPKKGHAWMGFNCSIRMINWIKIISSFKRIENISDKVIDEIYYSIYQNLDFIIRNIEHHIPGNHIVFQYFSVWLLANLFEDNRAKVYSKLFESEFINEFLESGLHFELSTHYHLQVLQLGVYFSLIKYKEVERLPPELLNVIRKAYQIMDSFTISKNTLPLIGDNCYNFFHSNLVEDAKNLNCLKSYFRIDDNIKIIKEIESNYLIINRFNSHLIFDVGNIGLKQNPGHGHSDLLSILYSYDGIPIFTDPGTKRYSNKSENMELKRASSHNTISVNGEDQSKLWGFFRWAFLPDKINYKYSDEDNLVKLDGEYFGFRNIGNVKHKREIELNDVELKIKDNVEFNQLSYIEQSFVLSDYVSVIEEQNKTILVVEHHKFEMIIETKFNYKFEVLNQKLYKSYDNPIDSKKIKIKYKCLEDKFETLIRLKRINE